MKDYIETQYKNLDFTIPDDYVSRRIVDVPENVETSTLMDGYVWWTCRACGNLQHTDKQVQYCSYCGQRVKWEDAEG